MTAPDNVVLLDIPRILESCVVDHMDDGAARWYLCTATDGYLERFCVLHMGSAETIHARGIGGGRNVPTAVGVDNGDCQDVRQRCREGTCFAPVFWVAFDGLTSS